MGAVDYLSAATTALKSLFENDSELGGYAATPYNLCDELVRVKKDYPGLSIELHTLKEGDWNVCNPEKILEYHIRTYTAYGTESDSTTANFNIAGRVVEILETESNWNFTTGSYRIDTEVNFEYETAISNQGKISRCSEVIADVYLRE